MTIELYFLFPAAIAEMFNPIAELVVPIGIPSKEANVEIEIHPVIGEAKRESVQYNLVLYKPFCTFYTSIHFALFFQLNNFFFCPYFSI